MTRVPLVVASTMAPAASGADQAMLCGAELPLAAFARIHVGRSLPQGEQPIAVGYGDASQLRRHLGLVVSPSLTPSITLRSQPIPVEAAEGAHAAEQLDA